MKYYKILKDIYEIFEILKGIEEASNTAPKKLPKHV